MMKGETAMNPRMNYNQHSPEMIKKLFELSQLSKQGSLGQSLSDLVHIRASQLNGCAFCLDMHMKEAKIHGERELRLFHLTVWRESPLFSDRERAVLEWTEAVTKLASPIPDSLYEQVRLHLSEKEMSDLTFAIGVINFWNRLNISSPTTPGSLDAMLGLTKAPLS
jgi:AhpD family alkylhydroperoxidase